MNKDIPISNLFMQEMSEVESKKREEDIENWWKSLPINVKNYIKNSFEEFVLFIKEEGMYRKKSKKELLEIARLLKAQKKLI